jgi:hypothetical protein
VASGYRLTTCLGFSASSLRLHSYFIFQENRFPLLLRFLGKASEATPSTFSREPNMFSVRSIVGPQLRRSIRQLHSASSAAAIEAERTIRDGPRNDWARDEIKSIYDSPVLDLLFHGVSIFFFLCLLWFIF